MSTAPWSSVEEVYAILLRRFRVASQKDDEASKTRLWRMIEDMQAEFPEDTKRWEDRFPLIQD